MCREERSGDEEYVKRRQCVMRLEFRGNALCSAHQKLLNSAVWQPK